MPFITAAAKIRDAWLKVLGGGGGWQVAVAAALLCHWVGEAAGQPLNRAFRI